MSEEKERFPIVIEDEDIQELIESAKALEWYAEHLIRRYHKKITKVWHLLEELHELDVKNHVYSLDGQPAILYVRPRREDRS